MSKAAETEQKLIEKGNVILKSDKPLLEKVELLKPLAKERDRLSKK